jgi:carbamoyltransferase
LFGDSFTAGEGVSNGQRYGDRLEQLVPDLEIYNFGLPATGLDQHYLIYKEYAQDIDHDILVIAVFVENIRRVGSRYRYFLDEDGNRILYAKPHFRLHNGELELQGVPASRQPVELSSLSLEDQSYISAVERFPKLKRLFNILRRDEWFHDAFIKTGIKDKALAMLGYQPIKEYDNPKNEAWLVMQALIAKWIKNHPKPIVLMPIPMHHYVYQIANPQPYQQRLRAATESAGGRYFDPLPGLCNYTLEQRRSFYFPFDGHLTKAGHEALALAIAPFISEFFAKRKAL